jgi:hypothetical protein
MVDMVLPFPSSRENDSESWVRCKCRVLRVEEIQPAREYGVAASIEEFETVQTAVVPEDTKAGG